MKVIIAALYLGDKWLSATSLGEGIAGIQTVLPKILENPYVSPWTGTDSRKPLPEEWK